MTEYVGDGKLDGAENEKLDVDDTTKVDIDLDESKAQLINGGAGADEYKTAIVQPTPASSDGEVSFNGLGKEEVMRYANDPFWVRLRWILFILFWVGWIAMLVTAVVIIVLAPRCPPRPDLKWYNTDTVYQVMPKTFKDSDDNGIGDFGGLKEKLDHITDDTKSKVIWLSSVYHTDGLDSGLGIIDHKAIDPSFGVTTEDFKKWLKKMRKDGKKVIMDLIPNQTSKNHTWFLGWQAGDAKYKDYYLSAENNGAVPNNWKSNYNDESAWTLDTKGNKYYLHQFSSEHPDLNLRSEAVKDEIKDIMKFWFSAGVSGFNIRGLEYLVENPDLTVADDDDRTQTRNFNDTLTFLEELRTVANEYSDKPGRERLLFGTVQHASRSQVQGYWGSEDMKRLHIVAPLMKTLDQNCDAACMFQLIDDHLFTDKHQWAGLQLGNQDMSRIATRMGKNEAKLMAAHALQLLLPGTPFNYYGDEFGQHDGDVPATAKRDMYGRDNYRTPMQWNSQKNAGFSASDKPWLPVGPDYMSNNVEASKAHFKDLTPFEAFQSLSDLRTRESFQWGKTKACTARDKLLMFTRKATRFPYFLVLINVQDGDFHVSSKDLECVLDEEEGTVVYHSREELVDEKLGFKDNALYMEPYDIIVMEFPSSD